MSKDVTAINASGGTVLAGRTGATISIPGRAGTSYLIQWASAPATALACARGGRAIGIR